MIAGFMTFTFTLLLHSTAVAVRRRRMTRAPGSLRRGARPRRSTASASGCRRGRSGAGCPLRRQARRRLRLRVPRRVHAHDPGRRRGAPCWSTSRWPTISRRTRRSPPSRADCPGAGPPLPDAEPGCRADRLGARAPLGAARALAEIRRALRPGGVCLVNVPSWRGKRYLELSAFKLGLSPAAEMDDHKMYYDVRDLWPLLVRAGFRPSQIRCFPHKFGLNTFASSMAAGACRSATAASTPCSACRCSSTRRTPGRSSPRWRACSRRTGC